MNSSHRYSLLATLLGAALVTLCTGTGAALAQPQRSSDSYLMTHSFDLTGDPASAAMRVEMEYRCWVDVRSRRCGNSDEDKGRVAVAIPGTTRFVERFADGGAGTGSYAIARALIANLFQPSNNRIQGDVTASGEGVSTWDGCTKFLKKLRKRNYSRFSSNATAFARGNNGWQTGGLQWFGDWVIGPTSSGERSIEDPVDARITDQTTGSTSSWRVITIKGFVRNGTLAWNQPIKRPRSLTNTAPEMYFEAVVDAPVIPVNQRGRLRIEVRNNRVSRLDATGIFDYITTRHLLTLGGPGAFSIDFPAIAFAYDLGGDPSHDLEIEFAMGGGAQGENLSSAFGNCNLITDVGNGFDRADTSMPRQGDGDLGFPAGRGLFHAADDFAIPAGNPLYLDSCEWPVFQSGAVGGAGPRVAYVRIWSGDPTSGGVIFAGNLSTNRLLELDDYTGVYRVARSDQLSTARRVQNAVVDLSWAPPLPPGPYWLEIAFDGDPAYAAPEVVPCSWGVSTDNGLLFDAVQQRWIPATDSFSGRNVDFVNRIYWDDEPPGCDADLNMDGVADFADFALFLDFYAADNPGADVTADDLVDFSDFLEYLNLFDAGC